MSKGRRYGPHGAAWLGALGKTPPAWSLLAILVLTIALPALGLLNAYLQQVFMYVGINIILASGLNLINGYMGEFSVGHAAFMGVGAYISAILTVWVIPRTQAPFMFPLVLLEIPEGSNSKTLLQFQFRCPPCYIIIFIIANRSKLRSR